MTNNMLKNQENEKQSKPFGRVGMARRDLLRKAMVASGVLAGAHLLPEKWFRPLVEQIVVPVHAQTSGEPENPPPPQSIKRVFVYTGGDQEFVVPAGITSLAVKLDGGDGGGGGGGANWTPSIDLLGGNGGAGSNGETVFATLAVTPGETLIFRIGGGGSPGLGAALSAPSSVGGSGGFPDGVVGGEGVSQESGGGGGSGGTTSILRGGTMLLSAQGGHGGGGGGLRTSEDMNCDGQDGRFGGAGGEANGGDGGAGYQAPFDDGGAGGAGGNSEGEAGLAGNNGEIELFY